MFLQRKYTLKAKIILVMYPLINISQISKQLAGQSCIWANRSQILRDPTVLIIKSQWFQIASSLP